MTGPAHRIRGLRRRNMYHGDAMYEFLDCAIENNAICALRRCGLRRRRGIYAMFEFEDCATWFALRALRRHHGAHCANAIRALLCDTEKSEVQCVAR